VSESVTQSVSQSKPMTSAREGVAVLLTVIEQQECQGEAITVDEGLCNGRVS
jgi:hypothetical protein